MVWSIIFVLAEVIHSWQTLSVHVGCWEWLVLVLLAQLLVVNVVFIKGNRVLLNHVHHRNRIEINWLCQVFALGTASFKIIMLVFCGNMAWRITRIVVQTRGCLVWKQWLQDSLRLASLSNITTTTWITSLGRNNSINEGLIACVRAYFVLLLKSHDLSRFVLLPHHVDGFLGRVKIEFIILFFLLYFELVTRALALEVLAPSVWEARSV